MHYLNNGSQVENVPPLKPRVGTRGYFTESNDDGSPSYPGQDWFNAVIREFQTAISASGVAFDPDKFDHIKKLLEANGNQFALYRSDRSYQTGEVCYTITNNELSFWQWYSNVESLSGKDPLDLNNRHENWSDNSKPFYWIPYIGDQVGMPFFWLSINPPEWAVMEINVDLPIAVYWRLARRYPHLVTGNTINTGEIRGEFLRVLDQGRGIDAGRTVNSVQSQMIESHCHTYREYITTQFDPTGGNSLISADSGGSFGGNRPVSYYGGAETRPRNVARAMAIAI